ncbi:MAG: nitrate reductase molybdenum cofactor assembly chaperone [Myxococcales bacterium]
MTERAAWAEFAGLFDYPRADCAERARRCLRLSAHSSLARFTAWAETADAGEIEEAYCAAFDLSPACAPYLGYHLCADPEQRGLFLATLAGEYAREDFHPAGELPDHLAEVLRFLAVARDEEARRVLLREGLAPALEHMAPALEGNPYRDLLDALREEARS